jgi:SAM-dependent methyltransferase
MHPTALQNCQLFFDCYGSSIEIRSPNAKVIEIGSQDVNGSIRDCCPKNFEYIGVDFVAGEGVDIVLDDPYSLPFQTESVDVVLSSSCFEHSELFWLLYLEVMRILKSSGLFYLNVPSNGAFHRYPVDCWRFYPDSGRALITWARRNNLRSELLESYTCRQPDQAADQWNDYIAVFLKDGFHVSSYPDRIISQINNFTNGQILGQDDIINYEEVRFI